MRSVRVYVATAALSYSSTRPCFATTRPLLPLECICSPPCSSCGLPPLLLPAHGQLACKGISGVPAATVQATPDPAQAPCLPGLFSSSMGTPTWPVIPLGMGQLPLTLYGIYCPVPRIPHPYSSYSEHACADKIPGLGDCPPEDLKIKGEWGPQVLNMRLLFLLVKDPDIQMTYNTPKIWPHFGCNKHIFRLFSSLLCSKKLWCVVPRYRTGPGINKSIALGLGS